MASKNKEPKVKPLWVSPHVSRTEGRQTEALGSGSTPARTPSGHLASKCLWALCSQTFRRSAGQLGMFSPVADTSVISSCHPEFCFKCYFNYIGQLDFSLIFFFFVCCFYWKIKPFKHSWGDNSSPSLITTHVLLCWVAFRKNQSRL